MTGGTFDMRARACTVRALLALAGGLAALPAAQARDVVIKAPAPGGGAHAGLPLTPAESALLRRALDFDTDTVADARPARRLRRPSLAQPGALDVHGSEKPDGAQTVAVKQSLATSEVEANVGADINTAAPPPTSVQPGEPLPGAVDARGSGAAWASVGLRNLASVDVRMDSANAQGQVGATLRRSVPVGDGLSVTIQNRLTASETYGTAAADFAAAAGLPLTAVPVPAPAAPPTVQDPAPVFGNEQSVTLDYKPTGTTFGVRVASASNDPLTHNTVSADQKLIGPLHVTAAVTDLGEPTASKSIGASFKLDW